MQYAAEQAYFAAESRTLEEEGDGMREQELLDRMKESYETENDDYRLRIEDMLVDGDVKVILISVEALNE